MLNGQMVTTLGASPEPLPAWLQQCRPPFDRNKFFGSRTVYYPGPGTDVEPVKLCAQANVAHAFLYVDTCYGDNGVALEQFCNCVQELEDWGYDAEREDDITMPALFADGWTPHVHTTDLSPEAEEAIDFNVKGSYVVLRRAVRHDESFGPKRLALLYVIGDGHIAYDAIYCQGDGTRAPYLVVVQDHGMAGNHSPFGRGGLLEQFAYQSSQYPEWLLVGPSPTGKGYRPWSGYPDTTDMPEQQGAAKNPRKLYGREEDCPLFVTRQSRHTRQNGIVKSMTRPTLKHEVHDILMAQGNGWMKPHCIADLVNERALYQSQTGSPVTDDEIFAIQRKHRQLFERHETRIRCREND